MGVCVAAGVLAATGPYPGPADAAVTARAVTALVRQTATVFTLEGGIVGLQHLVHFTGSQLEGYYCRPPNVCVPVDYQAAPGNQYVEMGADILQQAVASAGPDSGPIILLGHSEGAQVIDSVLRRWAADPSTAPDPAQVSWVSLGNPDNPYGGIRIQLGGAQMRPADTAYQGTEVIRQYDGWADWPDNPFTALAVANAVMGMVTIHPDYFNVDINSPQNVRYTPPLSDGSPGNITYVWVPTAVMPLVAWAGPLAPTLDAMLRPIVESAYDRPVTIPAPAATTPVLQTLTTTPTLSPPSLSTGDRAPAHVRASATESVVSVPRSAARHRKPAAATVTAPAVADAADSSSVPKQGVSQAPVRKDAPKHVRRGQSARD